MSDEILRLENVSMAYRGRVALAAVSFGVRRGEIVALLGPNGAGKSTLFATVLGHLRPTRGTVLIRGVAVARDRRRALAGVGAVLDAPAFHEHLSGWENLARLVSYAIAPDTDALRDAVRFVGIESRIDDRVGTYSSGMRQRLALAQALVPAPDLLLLDEPADGLDPEGVDIVHSLVGRVAAERGVAVVIASHLLAELEPVCTRVAILDGGRSVFDGRWPETPASRSLGALYRDALAAARAA
jgi:ABC-2 type transport system ATP-binding protein